VYLILWEHLLVENMHINDCKQCEYSYAVVRVFTVYSDASSQNFVLHVVCVCTFCLICSIIKASLPL